MKDQATPIRFTKKEQKTLLQALAIAEHYSGRNQDALRFKVRALTERKKTTTTTDTPTP